MSERLKNETGKILFLLSISELAHSFLYVTYTIFLVSRGMSLAQVSILCMICGIASLIFDIPTGAFADVVGRKKSFMASCSVWLVACVTYVLSSNFWGYAVAEILAALAMALSSGCVSAHLWDTVTAIGNELGHSECEIEKHNKSLSAKVIWVTSPVSAIGGFVGAKLLQVNSSIPWFATAIGMLVVIITAQRVLTETKCRKKISFVNDIKEMTANTLSAFRLLAREPSIRSIATLRALLRISSVPIFLYWTPYLKEVGGSVTVLGVAWVLMEIAMSVGVYLCRKVPDSFNQRKVIAFLMLTIAISAIFGAITRSFVPVLGAILVIEAATMALGYLFGNITQNEITKLGYGESGDENNKRATILSAVSSSITFGGIFGEFGSSQTVARLGISGSWTLAGILVLAISVVVYAFASKSQRQLAPTN